MNRRSVFFFLIGTALMSQGVFAAEKFYRCEVLSDAYIKTNGELVVVKDSPRVGLEFVVIKKTGEVLYSPENSAVYGPVSLTVSA